MFIPLSDGGVRRGYRSWFVMVAEVVRIQQHLEDSRCVLPAFLAPSFGIGISEWSSWRGGDPQLRVQRRPAGSSHIRQHPSFRQKKAAILRSKRAAALTLPL